MAGVTLTLAEACQLLEPPITERQLRAIVRALHVTPAGWRHRGTGRGHPVATYSVPEIMRLHGALSPWLDANPAMRVPAGS